MTTQVLKTFNSYWQARNQRERRLAIAVAFLLLAMLAYSTLQGARLKLYQLDAQIRTLQDELINAHHQVARRQTVEQQYSRIAAQHSSEWSEPEVQERLRQEIYRLAKKTPPPLNEQGIPEITSSDQGNLVEIPGLRQGTLSESEEGDYRQYSISFEVPPADSTAIFAFLERLQNSPQSLRIDGLELMRPPDSTRIGAKIQLARIIVAGAPAADPALDADLPAAGAPVETPGSGSAPALETPTLSMNLSDWTCEGCSASAETVGGNMLLASATAAQASFYTSGVFPPGKSFELTAELSVAGEGTLGVAGEDGTDFTGATALKTDGIYRYTIQFTAPATDGPVRLRVPSLRFGGEGATLRVHALTLRALQE